MYVNPKPVHYNYAWQSVPRGLFLLLIEDKNNSTQPIKALVRSVALTQCGQFMMGYARVYGKSLIVSGSYGADGLPMQVDSEIYNRAKLELPQELFDAWATGGGWNSAGSEAEAMAKWANENLKELRG